MSSYNNMAGWWMVSACQTAYYLNHSPLVHSKIYFNSDCVFYFPRFAIGRCWWWCYCWSATKLRFRQRVWLS